MMEYVIGICVFLFLAKKGLRKQGLELDVKDAASDVAANISLELADILDITPKKISKK
jgi:hypothetical protein|nr:MAG TPA: hypothetical protein [Caudoviricetes sp.]